MSLSLVACIKKTDSRVILDPDKIESFNLISEEIEFDEMPMFPKGCKVVDSILILFEPNLNDGFLSLYSLNSNQLIKRFGILGDGPCDFINPRFFQNYQFDSDKRSLFVADSKYFYNLNVDSIIAGYDNCENTKIDYVPAELKGFNYILKLSDTSIIANITGDYQINKFNILNKETETLSYYSKLPGLDVNDFVYATQIYDGYYTSNDKYIIIGYKNFKQIDILSSEGNFIKSIYFSDFDRNLGSIRKKDNANIEFRKRSEFFYSYIFVGESNFYALCWNSSKENIKKNIAIPEIQVFNENGEIINILKPNIPISYFSVDEFNSKIYAIGMSEEEDLRVYSLDLPCIDKIRF